jgi:hypothetical protein
MTISPVIRTTTERTRSANEQSHYVAFVRVRTATPTANVWGERANVRVRTLFGLDGADICSANRTYSLKKSPPAHSNLR